MSAKQFPLLNDFVAFIRERHEIHKRRAVGLVAPWTKDPILAAYRFTNVLREQDRVTKWVHEYWLTPDEPDVWFAVYVARVFNKPVILEETGWPLPWSKARRRQYEVICAGLQSHGDKLFNAAYIVSTHRVKQPKVDYYMDRFDELWKHRAKIRPTQDDTLAGWADRFMQYPGVGGFMAAQVVADIKHVAPLLTAPDWNTFARSGPGSRRGLNRLMGRAVRATWRPQEWHDQLLALRGYVLPKLQNSPELCTMDAQNLQNNLCEFDKYCRARYNEGRPKQLYRPKKEDDDYVQLHSK